MMCIICNNKSFFFLKKDDYQYQKCPSCGLVFVHPQPDEKHLREEVYSKKSGYQRHRKKVAVKESPHIKKILDYLQNQIPNGKLLDVGCSNGDFLYFAKLRGFEPHGVEINELTAHVAESRGLAIKHGTLENARFENNFFDTIFLGDIIEHVPNPRALLRECGRILKKEGMLVISTPNLDSFWAKKTFLLYKFLKIPWSVLTPPHHLFQFSEGNVKKFLKDNGFKPISVWFRRPPTLKYELGFLHLWGKFKQEKTAKNFLFMIFAFSAYTKLYILDMLITPFKKKDFGMILCMTKTKN